LDKEVIILYAVNNGYLDDVPVEKVAAFEQGLYRFMDTNHPKIGKSIIADKEIKSETEADLKKVIPEFKQSAAY